jgi:hypothetical protein
VITATLVAACTSGATPSPGSPTASGTPATSDAFAGLPYRLDLPAGWIVLGDSAYDASLDSGADVASWLDALDLQGSHAFRAYEPQAAAGGLRVALNPASPWRSESVLDDGGLVAALPGVTGTPDGDLVAVGAAAKATRFRWTETLDWGSGSPSARTVVGYGVMGEFGLVHVIFSYPAETDRLAEVEAMMATFEELAAPAVSLPPGVTMPPSPSPYDKYSSEPSSPAASATASFATGIGHVIQVNLYVPVASDAGLRSACDAATLRATGPKAAMIPGSTLRFSRILDPTDATLDAIGEAPVPPTGTVMELPGSAERYCVFTFDVTTTADTDPYFFSVGSIYFPMPIIPRDQLVDAGWVVDIGVNPQ